MITLMPWPTSVTALSLLHCKKTYRYFASVQKGVLVQNECAIPVYHSKDDMLWYNRMSKETRCIITSFSQCVYQSKDEILRYKRIRNVDVLLWQFLANTRSVVNTCCNSYSVYNNFVTFIYFLFLYTTFKLNKQYKLQHNKLNVYMPDLAR